MQRTKAPPKSEGKRGPASKCTSEVVQQAYRLCLLGMTNADLADAFEVHETTIEYWCRKYSDFKKAVERGRTFADSHVVEKLYERALGYSHNAVKFFKTRVTEKEYDDNGNVIKERSWDEIIEQPYTKHYPPDVKAAIKILSTRHRASWGQAVKVEHDHNHLVAANINIHQVLEQISDSSQFSDDELRTIGKLGLSKAVKEITDGK